MSYPSPLSLKDKSFLSQVWSLAHPYWRSDEKRIAWLLLGLVVGLNYLIVEVAVLYSNWNRDFFNLMQNEEWNNFWNMLGQFVLIMMVYTVIDLAEEYLRRTLRIRWRRWLTHIFLKKWLGGKRLYRHQLSYPASDNPDQRISQDVKDFCDKTLFMGLGLLRTVTSLFSFVVILWNLSGSLTFEFGGSEWVIPGYMVWVAIVYSVIGTWLTHKIAKRLVPLNFEQEKSEADFRFHLMRVREHAESIALQRGESAENHRTQSLFGKVWDNWQQLTGMKLKYGAFTSGYNEVARIFPYLVASPRLMSGALQLGDMMQTATGFYRVQEAFSWFVDSYESLADWRAVTDRLITFHTQLEALPAANVMPRSNQPEWRDLNLYSPEQQPLLAEQSGNISQSITIKGVSGGGKSTFIRSLAGLWPYQSGEVSMPDDRECMFIPQKPYLPNASLRDILLYPNGESISDSDLVDALTHAGVSKFGDKLDFNSNWQQSVSGGELQKIMLARSLVQKPQWLFLDEAMSALDPESYRSIREIMVQQLPDTHVVEVSHRETHEEEQNQIILCTQTQSFKYS
ncbi:ABC transporter ATP-binding protein/permease [Vibrio gigantis]|uniref:ABC transporter ATP-binding protein/permease n=1 Tax=Vibrio gigantis TaxID=296199 RepID=UPI001BFD71AF|nr:ABC transporter ATP-binding protein/permease [Vibrio gigantis]